MLYQDIGYQKVSIEIKKYSSKDIIRESKVAGKSGAACIFRKKICPHWHLLIFPISPQIEKR